jgi:hypothetical protein
MRKHYSLCSILIIVLLIVSCGGSGGSGGSGVGSASNTGTATLTWIAPTQNADNTTLTDLAGYKVYYGYSGTGHYDYVVDVGNVTTFKLSSLPAGYCVFVVRAYNLAGVESDLSSEQSKTIN